MPRHDRGHGVHHEKRASAGNKRRVPSREKSRNKVYRPPVEERPAKRRASA